MRLGMTSTHDWAGEDCTNRDQTSGHMGQSALCGSGACPQGSRGDLPPLANIAEPNLNNCWSECRDHRRPSG